MGNAKAMVMTAISVLAVLAAVHYLAPAELKKHVGLA